MSFSDIVGSVIKPSLFYKIIVFIRMNFTAVQLYEMVGDGNYLQFLKCLKYHDGINV